MEAAMTGMQFVLGCLALGMGLFLVSEAARGLSSVAPVRTVGARAMTALGGTLLLAAGAYAALLTIPR